MLQYIPYILLFALATAIIYAWGLWRSMRQKQDDAGPRYTEETATRGNEGENQ